jgi:hypothetical protein
MQRVPNVPTPTKIFKLQLKQPDLGDTLISNRQPAAHERPAGCLSASLQALVELEKELKFKRLK